MANSDYTNTVPLGEAGTGAAFLLPGSTAINGMDNYLDTQIANKQAAATQRQANTVSAAAAVAKNWKTNQLNIKGGTLYQPEINTRSANVMNMGYQLQKAGADPDTPNSNPQVEALRQQYQTQRDTLLSDVGTRDAISKQAAENEKAILSQPAGYYDQGSIDAYHKYIDGSTPLSTITANGMQMPMLKRAFNLNTATEKLQAVPTETTSVDKNTGVEQKLVLPNEAAHTAIANDFLNNNPEAQADLAGKTGMPYNQIGNNPNPVTVKQQLDDHYRSLPNIPSLASQGVNTFGGLMLGQQGAANSNGIPDQVNQQGAPFVNQPTPAGVNPKYDALLNSQANQMANAAQTKADYINTIKTGLDNKVHQVNNQSYNFSYQKEMMERQRLGMETVKFNKWQTDQQNEAGQFQLGNQGSNVVVPQTWATGTKIPLNSDGKPQSAGSTIEPGASLYGINLPDVKTIVNPSEVTNTTTGKTTQNTDPLDVDVSQIKMVPVFQNLNGTAGLNGSEVSARQLKAIVAGQGPNGVNMTNVAFKPYAYGIQHLKNPNNIHSSDIPIKFSYDALKGSNVKKINTTTFDKETIELQKLQNNPKYQSMSPQDQLDFIKQRYNLKLDQ